MLVIGTSCGSATLRQNDGGATGGKSGTGGTAGSGGAGTAGGGGGLGIGGNAGAGATGVGGSGSGGAGGHREDGGAQDGAARDATSDAPVGIPTDHLLAYFPFNGNTNDESGNGYTAMADLGMFDTDRFGEANKAYNLIYNNSSDWYGIVSCPSLPVTTSFTFAIWVRVSPNGNNERIAGVGNWVALQFSGQNATFGLQGMSEVVADPNPITKNQWTFLVGVVAMNTNGDLISLYRDGNLVASQMFTDFFLAGSPSTCRFYMGNSLLGGTSQNCTGSSQANEFPGDVDDVRVYSRALTGAEIQALYHQTP